MLAALARDLELDTHHRRATAGDPRTAVPGLDELRYRLHLKAVHAMIKGIPTHRQYFPLARDQRAHYHRTGNVAPIPLPTRNPHQSNRSPTPSARPRGNGSKDLSKTERDDLMAKSAPGDEVSGNESE